MYPATTRAKIPPRKSPKEELIFDLRRPNLPEDEATVTTRTCVLCVAHPKHPYRQGGVGGLGIRPRSIYQYSNMAPRLSGQTSIFGVVFFVFESLLGIARQKKLKKITI